MSFKDHFSGHASVYASFRPSYPEALFDFIASLPARLASASVMFIAAGDDEPDEELPLPVILSPPSH